MTAGDPPHDPTRPDAGPPEERYERLERIAAGGMGEVWRARDRVLGREVAVKVLRREYADDATFRARFQAEARHTAGIGHPGVASLYDYGVSGGAPFLVMELVPGRPLSDLLAGDRPVDPEQARRLVTQAAEALGAAHAQGLVHRDVKPGNLLVTPAGQVKVTDFGIARAADSVPMTQTGQVIGTPHYLSPEQARGDSATAASDVYALGVVLFECLAGRRPFSADSAVGTALAHLQQEVPDLPSSVPADLARVTRRALAKDPAERYPDGAALAAALRGEEDDRTALLPPTARPAPDTATRVAPVAVPPGPPRRPVEAAPPPERRRGVPAWLLPAAVLALLLLGLLVWHPWSRGATPAPTSGTVQVDQADYVGRPLAQVERELRAKGLVPYSVLDTGTVTSVTPSGPVRTGSRVRVRVRTTAPSASPTATAPTPSATPTPSPSSTPSTTTSAPSPTATATEKAPKAPKLPKVPGGSSDSGRGSGKGKGN